MRFAVALHNIRSIHNVGSIFRTADAAGAERIYLCGITPAPLDRFGALRPDFSKVALGAQDYVAWESAKSSTAVLKRLRRDGWRIFAVEQSSRATPYFKIPARETRAGKFCLVMGAEVRGLPPSVLALADRVLEIPMSGKKESLNVAVAFGVVAFGLRRPSPRPRAAAPLPHSDATTRRLGEHPSRRGGRSGMVGWKHRR